MPAHDLSRDPWNVDPAAFPADGSPEDKARFLLRLAILAPSSHNSQPWAFRVEGETVELRIDPDRWLRVADPDRRELEVSVGCALETLVVAARRFGLQPRIELPRPSDRDRVARVALAPAPAGAPTSDPGLFEAILRRRTSHDAFTERGLEDDLLERIEVAAREAGTRLVPVAEGQPRERLAQLQREADERQMDDRAYREELGEWIGSGALGDDWPRARIAQWVVTHFDLGPREGRDNAAHLRRAPLVGVLTTASDDRPSRIRAGRAYQRIALHATAEDVATQPLSQILEVPDLKARLAELLELDGEVPQHLFRAGHAETGGEHTPRWPLERFLAG